MGPGSTAVAGAADGNGSGTPWWPGVVTGVGAAAALAFALWPAWRRSRTAPEPDAALEAATALPTGPPAPVEAGGAATADADAAGASDTPAPPVAADLHELVIESRARLEHIATQAGQHEARVIEQIAARQMQSLRDAASNANAQLERLVGEWQARLEAAAASGGGTAAGGGGTVGAAVVPAPAASPQAMQTAVEAFQRLRRIQQEAMAELEEARADAVTSIDSARADLERTASERAIALDAAATQHLAELDQTGTRWLGRIEKAARQNGSAPTSPSRRRRVAPPVVGVVVAVALAVGAVGLAVGGDNRSSDAGPRLRAAGPPDVTSTTVPTTTVPPETTPPTPPSTVASTSPVTSAITQPRVTTPVTQPPVATLAPPPLPNLPPVTAPRNPAVPDNICRLVPAIC